MAELSKKKIDPFEEAFLDFFHGKDNAEIIIHSNKGDDEAVPVNYFFRRYDEMPELEIRALELCIGKILDVGAGAGCHTKELQSNGYDITAMEVRDILVEILKNQGIKKTILADFYSYQDDKFDTLLFLMNGIGICKDLPGLKTILKHSKTLLNPKGQILLDSTDIMYLYQEDDGSFRVPLNESYYGEVEYSFEYDGKIGESFRWLFVDFSTLAVYAEQEGYSCEMIFEGENHHYLAKLCL